MVFCRRSDGQVPGVKRHRQLAPSGGNSPRGALRRIPVGGRLCPQTGDGAGSARQRRSRAASAPDPAARRECSAVGITFSSPSFGRLPSSTGYKDGAWWRRISLIDASSTIRPAYITATRSAISTRGADIWVTNTIDEPAFAFAARAAGSGSGFVTVASEGVWSAQSKAASSQQVQQVTVAGGDHRPPPSIPPDIPVLVSHPALLGLGTAHLRSWPPAPLVPPSSARSALPSWQAQILQ